jgi:hypothetical protein
MMPAHVKALVRRLSTAVVLLALIPCLLVWLARHSVVPLWPAPVEEVLYLDSSGEVHRSFAQARSSGEFHGLRQIARGRPHSLVCLELSDGQLSCGFLLGVRAGKEQALDRGVPDELLSTVVEPGQADWAFLVMADSDDQSMEFGASEVRRLIYPNRMIVTERIILTWHRFAGRLHDRLVDEEGLAVITLAAGRTSPR